MGKSKELATLTDAGGSFSGNLSIDTGATDNSYLGGGALNIVSNTNPQNGSTLQLTKKSPDRQNYISFDQDVLFLGTDANSTDHANIGGKAGVDLRLLAGGSTRMTIDASGRMTMPYQPSFMVRPSDSATYSGSGFWAISNWTASGVGCHNTGGHMGSQYFTAPVSGRYYFHASFLHQSGSVNNWVGFAFYVNDVIKVDNLGSSFQSTYDYQRNSQSVILSLQAGDTVNVAIRDDGGDGYVYSVGAGATPYSWFTGYLIG